MVEVGKYEGPDYSKWDKVFRYSVDWVRFRKEDDGLSYVIGDAVVNLAYTKGQAFIALCVRDGQGNCGQEAQRCTYTGEAKDHFAYGGAKGVRVTDRCRDDLNYVEDVQDGDCFLSRRYSAIVDRIRAYYGYGLYLQREACCLIVIVVAADHRWAR